MADSGSSAVDRGLGVCVGFSFWFLMKLLAGHHVVWKYSVGFFVDIAQRVDTSLDYAEMNSRHAEVAPLKKEAAGAEDEDLTIPRAAMNKMIKELLPNVRIANEARELILACCTEFIHHLSTEANDICNRQQKKTISADHVLGGLVLNQNLLVFAKNARFFV
ncbi:hypothetical protein HPB51_028076 [Rhipicephalus microplus]|uniref:Protein Dr1 n=1 Tax=Rhipicephalus microplus TaxID=6941 RepID=A0A9J6CY71_RHIMP|nr:hypothetical protein HPB51_028076 [Rhipicephalus microplus]